jgi:O-acetylhomoserine/O-acetylserine sulfhydrylase-like pyridoxal-dependent enzyme
MMISHDTEPRTKEEWIARGQEMMADRDRRIARAKQWNFDTVATHGLYDLSAALESNNGSIMEPVYLSPAQAYRDSNHMEASLAYEMPTWCYSRIANPTLGFLEDTAALLESYGAPFMASCVVTGSGMAAVRTATDPFLVRDEHYRKPNIVASAKVYGGTFQQLWVRRHQEAGIDVRWVLDPTNLEEWQEQIDAETRFVFGEFPSNPSVALFDIEKVSELAHSYGAPLIVDSTCASPALTRPLTMGADIVVQSASKAIGGSGAAISGYVASRPQITSKIGPDEMRADFATWAKLWPFRDNGPALSPMSAFLVLSDIRTLRMRMAQMSRSTMQVAEFLEDHHKVAAVHYPGLPNHPGYDIARRSMRLVDSEENAYGYMLSVEIAEDAPDASRNARVFYDKLDMIWRATDLGRVKTVATLNAISTHQQQGEEGRRLADIQPSTCRISCGIEDPADIIADLSRALDAI